MIFDHILEGNPKTRIFRSSGQRFSDPPGSDLLDRSQVAMFLSYHLMSAIYPNYTEPDIVGKVIFNNRDNLFVYNNL